MKLAYLPVIMVVFNYSCGSLNNIPYAPSSPSPVVTFATPEQIRHQEVLEHSYLVAFKSELGRQGLYFSSYRQEYQAHYLTLSQRFANDSRIKNIDFITAIDLSKPTDPQWQAEFSPPQALQLAWQESSINPEVGALVEVNFDNEESAEAILKQWGSDNVIWFAEPQYQSKLFAGPIDGYKDTYKTLSDNSWWLKAIGITKAFDHISEKNGGAEAPVIAVMDSGIDRTHPNLKDHIWQNDAINAAGCINDEFGCNTTVGEKGILGDGSTEPYGVALGQVCPKDPESQGCDRRCCHGTHVAGIIAASPAQSIGGICPLCQVMAIRIMGISPDAKKAEPTIIDKWIIKGFKYVLKFTDATTGKGLIRVVNASFGKFQRSKGVSLLVRNLKEAGTLVVAAAGNEDSMKMQFPAAFSDAIAVASLNESLNEETKETEYTKFKSSNFGRWVDIAAPGAAIKSSIPGGSFEDKSGTSMASPIVAGIAGLILLVDPTIPYQKLRSQIIQSADSSIYAAEVNQYYLPKVPGERAPSPLLGTGIVNAEKAVKGQAGDNLPVLSGLDRVTENCGVVANGKPLVSTISLLLVIFPLFLVFFVVKFDNLVP